MLRIGFPHIVTWKICGRTEEVAELMDYFKSEEPRPVLVAAVGGQGKTTLAVAFENRLEADNVNAVATWLNGSGIGPLTASVQNLCRQLNCATVG